MDETSVQDEVAGQGNEGGAPTVSNTGRGAEIGMVFPGLPVMTDFPGISLKKFCIFSGIIFLSFYISAFAVMNLERSKITLMASLCALMSFSCGISACVYYLWKTCIAMKNGPDSLKDSFCISIPYLGFFYLIIYSFNKHGLKYLRRITVFACFFVVLFSIFNGSESFSVSLVVHLLVIMFAQSFFVTLFLNKYRKEM